jgi:hypothetical protein
MYDDLLDFLDEDDWYWYDKPFLVYEEEYDYLEDAWYEYFVCKCFGEYEARWYEQRGYRVYNL